jgi:hypothetical protein
MTDEDRFRQRLVAVGADIPDGLLGFVFVMAGGLVSAIDRLIALDLGDTEPFCPTCRLPDDAA